MSKSDQAKIPALCGALVGGGPTMSALRLARLRGLLGLSGPVAAALAALVYGEDAE